MPKVNNIFQCPICGAATKVLRTRSALATRLIRYRVCTAGHKTTTREVVDSEANTPRPTVDRTLVTIALCELASNLGIEITSSVKNSSIPENDQHGDHDANKTTNSSR